MNKLLIVSLLLCALLGACTRSADRLPPDSVTTVKQEKVVIYQMMTRLFGNTKTTNKLYGTLEENGVGKFNDITAEALHQLHNAGYTHIWYTGIIEHATLSDYSRFGITPDDADVVKGRAGSPYAIKDYYDVNPDLAINVAQRMAEFEQLIQRTHEAGLKVIIDFVPNHVARHYHSDVAPKGVRNLGDDDDRSVAFKPSNNFYYLPGQSFAVPAEYNPLGEDSVQSEDGKFDESPARVTGNDQFVANPGVNEWFETVKLNYGVDIQHGRQMYFDPVPDTWIKMRDILQFWAKKNVDGFRCDMAEMVPVEFWNWVIPQVKQINNQIIFIAEIYNPDQYRNYIQTGRFDYLYDKVLLYDTLRALLRSERNVTDIHAIQQRLQGINDHMLHFLENHDEQRIASPYFAGDPWKAVSAMTVSALIDKGPVMVYFGQEVGEPGRGAEGFQGDDGRTTIFDYWGVPEHQKWVSGGSFSGDSLSEDQKALHNFYSTLMNLARTNPAIVNGDYDDITPVRFSPDNSNLKDIHAFVRYTDKERLLIVSSFTSRPKRLTLEVPDSIANKLSISKEAVYTLPELLWKDTTTLTNNTLTIEVAPYRAYVFKIN